MIVYDVTRRHYWRGLPTLSVYDVTRRLGALSINVASLATLSGNGDVNGTVGNVTMLQRGLKLTLIPKFCPEILAICSFNVFDVDLVGQALVTEIQFC